MANKEVAIFEAAAKSLGATVLPDNAQWSMRLNIRSESSSRIYTVARKKSDNTWGCSCPGWRTRRTCKHLTAMVPALEAALRQRKIG
jgi:hypothetical protein